MPDKRILMAKMTAKGVQLTTGLGGGSIIISPEDVAAGLAMGGERKLHLKAYTLGLVKYCDDESKVFELRGFLKNEISMASRVNGKEIKVDNVKMVEAKKVTRNIIEKAIYANKVNDDIDQRISKDSDKLFSNPNVATALAEEVLKYIDIDELDGLVDVLMEEGVWLKIHKPCQGRGCSQCVGGIKQRSTRQRANIARLPRSTYDRNWAKPISTALMKMDSWDQECMNHLWLQFASHNPKEVAHTTKTTAVDPTEGCVSKVSHEKNTTPKPVQKGISAEPDTATDCRIPFASTLTLSH